MRLRYLSQDNSTRQCSLALNPTVQPQGCVRTLWETAVCWVILWPYRTHCMWGCTTWACRPCSGPASRPERAQRQRQRPRILQVGGKGSWRNTAPCAKQGMVAVLTTPGRRRLPFIGGSDVRRACQLLRAMIKPYN